MEIKGILVSALAPFENHIANGGEKLLGNAGSIKRRPDGRVYVSGQMQRHVFFSAIDRLNMADADKGDTFVSTGDGTTDQIENDLRADLGGFLHTIKDGYSVRRTAPLSVTPAVAMEASEVKNDLLVRVKNDFSKESKEQALATKEFSQSDLMSMNFFLDITSMSVTKALHYENGFNIRAEFIKHVTDKERKRRTKLYLEATRYMNDYANQARNAVCGEPEKVIIVFDTVLSRKACRYFTADEVEKKNILAELDERGAKYFIGDDKTENTVAAAYKNALIFLADNELSNPAGNDNTVMKFEKALEKIVKK